MIAVAFYDAKAYDRPSFEKYGKTGYLSTKNFRLSEAFKKSTIICVFFKYVDKLSTIIVKTSVFVYFRHFYRRLLLLREF